MAGDFPSRVTDFWLRGVAPSARRDRVHIMVDASLADSRSVSLFTMVDGPQILVLSPVRADQVGVMHGDDHARDRIASALAAADITLNDPDTIFHFSTAASRELSAEVPPPGVRALTLDDRAAFERFIASAPEDDVDEAFVELDHWLVFGSFVDGVLVGAASMYPWDDSTVADTGVLTLPEHRGRGHAAATVRAISAEALRRGFEPQYRCQVDNAASIAVARSAGLTLLGTWEVVLPAG